MMAHMCLSEDFCARVKRAKITSSSIMPWFRFCKGALITWHIMKRFNDLLFAVYKSEREKRLSPSAVVSQSHHVTITSSLIHSASLIHCFFLLFRLVSDKLVTLRSNSSSNLRHSSAARIIDSQDIKNVSSESRRFLEDSKAVNPDEVCEVEICFSGGFLAIDLYILRSSEIDINVI